MEHFRWRIGGTECSKCGWLSSKCARLILLIGVLALFFSCWARLVIWCFFTQKKARNFYVFLLCHSSRACSSDYFWTIAFVLARAQKKKVPFQKNSQLGDDVASEVREARSIESTAHMWECPQAGWCWLQRVCQHSCVVETAVIRLEFGLLFLFHRCCFISHSKSFFKL